MNSQQFINDLIIRLTAMFPDGTQISTQTIQKNNGVFLDALIIREPGINISPTIYLNDYYGLYTDGVSLDELCHIICDVFLEARLNHPIHPDFFTDFTQARKNLIFQIINYEKNEQRLSDIPHIRYLDLAIIFCCMVRLKNGESATITIRNEHLQLWHTDFDTVKKQAFDNTPRLLPAYIQPITDVIRDLMDRNTDLKPLIPLPETSDTPCLYVLTNETQNGGAACMLYPTLLADFANDMNTDFYILPSSIHEVLLLPTDERKSDESLRELVQSVNSEQVPLIQQLSDNIYFYSKAKNKLTL